MIGGMYEQEVEGSDERKLMSIKDYENAKKILLQFVMKENK